jgi:hypothetical protein
VVVVGMFSVSVDPRREEEAERVDMEEMDLRLCKMN